MTTTAKGRSPEERELEQALAAVRRLMADSSGWELDTPLLVELYKLAPGAEGVFDGVRVRRSPSRAGGFCVITQRTGHRRKKLPNFVGATEVVKTVLLARLRATWSVEKADPEPKASSAGT